jgi:hypothetical protein
MGKAAQTKERLAGFSVAIPELFRRTVKSTDHVTGTEDFDSPRLEQLNTFSV